MLNIKNLSLGYSGRTVLHLEHLHLSEGEHCLITGASGSGKTTLLYAIAGLIGVQNGTIMFRGTDITSLSEARRDHFRGQNIGIVFQSLHLVRSLSVLDNLLLASYAAGLPQDETDAMSILYKLGIHHKRNTLPSALSQGQAQRVAIARAILHQPSLILADEPTSSLDDASCENVITLLKKSAEETDAALLISTHDHRVKAHFSNVIHLGEAK